MTRGVSAIADFGSGELGQSEAAARKAAAFILRVRKAARTCFGRDGPNDSAWNVLLALYASHDPKRALHIASVSKRSQVPRTTVLRGLLKLQEGGYVSLEPDPNDKRAVTVRMTDEGSAAMERCFTAARFIV